MPYTWKLLELRLKDNIFNNLRTILNKAVKNNLRKKTAFK